jgi:hypothetical protein
MSDHVDGPRSIGEPAADVTDLFAFTSPEDPARTVLAMCVFPSAGEHAVFSNAIDHSIVVRHASVAGVGDAARFEVADDEIRFSFSFGTLERAAADATTQRGVCKLPDGRKVSLTVNDEKGATTTGGDVRVFAGLRSDPFYLAWLAASLEKVPNLLQNDNVLVLVVEVDTERVLDPGKGSLFGAIAETVPLPRPAERVSHPPPRVDWVGRPEQTNVRLDNPGLRGAVDLRDLWNQQTPFAIAEDVRPLFLQRLKDSFADWDLRDGKADWTSEALAANARVFLDDFLLFDVTKPITDESHLEIEKSTLAGLPYRTGGGRTIDANVIDILLTWLVNHDREFLQGGATGATKPGTKSFPYFASPNSDVQTVTDSVELAESADSVWSRIGDFSLDWHPLVVRTRFTGTGIGQLRTITTRDGNDVVERLEEVDASKRFYRYSQFGGFPATHYTGLLEAKANGSGSVVSWRVQYFADNKPDIVVRTRVSTLIKAGLGSLTRASGR